MARSIASAAVRSDLFRYFTEVNATEGGIDSLFADIGSPAAFVRYLLSFVADEHRVAPVRDLLDETAAEIAKRPVYSAERDFCAEAQPLVAALGEDHNKVAVTAIHREGMRAEAAGFKRALLNVADAAENEAEVACNAASDWKPNGWRCATGLTRPAANATSTAVSRQYSVTPARPLPPVLQIAVPKPPASMPTRGRPCPT